MLSPIEVRTLLLIYRDISPVRLLKDSEVQIFYATLNTMLQAHQGYQNFQGVHK